MMSVLEWSGAALASTSTEFRFKALFLGLGIIAIIMLPLVSIMLVDWYGAKRIRTKLDEISKAREQELRSWMNLPENAFPGSARINRPDT